MARRSRRGKKSSGRNLYLSVVVIVILVVAAGGYYALYGHGTNSVTTASSSGSSTTSSSSADQYAVLQTSQGQIVLQLFPQVAPKTVANFVSLADSGFYNNLVWHRIVPASTGFGILQTGDPNTKGAVNSTRSTWGQGTSPNSVPLEVNSAYHNAIGYVGLAHTSASTSGSCQFYINLTDNSQSLDGQYTVFAQVVQGMDVVNALAAQPIYSSSSSPFYDQPVNAQNALLISVTIQSTP